MSDIQKNPDNPFKYGALAMVYSSMGREEEALPLIQELISANEFGAFSSHIAGVYSWRGDKDEAFHWLDRAFQEKEASIAYILGDPSFRTLLDDPRWAEFLQKVGLYEYWLAMPPEYGGPQGN